MIGDRALGAEPLRVAALGRAQLDGLAGAGVAGIVKHIPGHGRAHADSHKELPVVTASDAELEIDIAPFRALAHAPVGDDRAYPLHRLGPRQPGDAIAVRDRRDHPQARSASTGC